MYDDIIMNGKQIIKRLQAEGWHLARIQGSHHIMQKDNKTVPIPVHGSKDISIGLITKIQKQSGVKLK